MKSIGYFRPKSIEETLFLIKKYNNSSKILAGGTDLLIDGRQRKYIDRYIIDITFLDKLKGISEDSNNLHIGSLTTLDEICNSPVVNKYAKLLAESSGVIGSPQIRNRATIGGNIANASPAADTIPALVALQSKVTIVSVSEKKELSVQELINGLNSTILNSDELILNIIVPKLSLSSRSKFIKLGRRNSLAISRISFAGIAEQDDNNIINDIRLVPGSVFPRPVRLKKVESLLYKRKPSNELIKKAAKAAEDSLIEVTGNRWSTPYKKPVFSNLCKYLLLEILKGAEE